MKEKDPIRLAMIAPGFPLESGKVSGGVESATYYLCMAMAQTGQVEIHAIRPFSAKEELGTRVVDGVVVHPLEHMRRYTKLLSVLVLSTFQIRRLIRQIAPDIIHVQNLSHTATRMPEPCVFTLHGISEIEARLKSLGMVGWAKSKIFALTAGRARNRLANVIAISPYTRQHLHPTNVRQRVWDIPNPILESFFDVLRHPVPGRILSASHMFPMKNVHTLIAGFAKLLQQCPEAELRLAGAYQQSEYGHLCAATAKELGIAARVKMLGLLSIAELQEELAAASCFALCSQQENAPMSIAEAMAAGVPVVASRVGGIPWMVQEGATGSLVNDPLNPDEIAEKLACVLFAGEAARIGERAKMEAERYRAAAVAKRTIAVYREILAS